MSEEDEVFLEKSFQRTLIVSPLVQPIGAYISQSQSLTLVVGARETHLVLGDPDCRMAPDGRSMLCESGILLVGETKRK